MQHHSMTQFEGWRFTLIYAFEGHVFIQSKNEVKRITDQLISCDLYNQIGKFSYEIESLSVIERVILPLKVYMQFINGM